MPTINSSAIASVDYENGYLTVNFRDGTTYIYRGVPQSVYDELLAANSAGRYFNEHIRDEYDIT